VATKRHRFVLVGQLLLPQLWQLHTIILVVEILVCGKQGGLTFTQQVVAEEVDYMQSPNHVHLQATIASKEWHGLEIHVCGALRVFEGQDGRIRHEAQTTGAEYELEHLKRGRSLDLPKRSNLSTLNRVSLVHGNVRDSGCTRLDTLEDTFQDVGALDDVVE
jgi:hypothetical protein